MNDYKQHNHFDAGVKFSPDLAIRAVEEARALAHYDKAESYRDWLPHWIFEDVISTVLAVFKFAWNVFLAILLSWMLFQVCVLGAKVLMWIPIFVSL